MSKTQKEKTVTAKGGISGNGIPMRTIGGERVVATLDENGRKVVIADPRLSE